jgi:hypothetical protein
MCCSCRPLCAGFPSHETTALALGPAATAHQAWPLQVFGFLANRDAWRKELQFASKYAGYHSSEVAMRDKYFGSHELQLRTEAVKTSSDRNFGLVFAAFAAVVGSIGVANGTGRWPIWFGFAAVMLILALTAPKLLAPLNWAWTKLGLLLHVITSPIVLAILFYVCIAPIGLLMRLSGRDPLHRRYDSDAESYWIPRDPPGPQRETFQNQF